MLPFYIRFERKAFVSREIVLVAVLAAIAAVSRVPFSVLPSVQPTSFVIIVSAIVFGSETGFMIGATAAIVSNIFRTRSVDAVANVFMGYDWFYSWIIAEYILMKSYGKTSIRIVCWIFIWLDYEFLGLLGFIREATWETVISYYIASFYFDLSHAISNVVFLLLFSTSWITILTRFKRNMAYWISITWYRKAYSYKVGSRLTYSFASFMLLTYCKEHFSVYF